MKNVLSFAIAALFATTLAAQEPAIADDPTLFIPADSADLNEFAWKYRPLVVFADTPNDPRFVTQMQLLRALPQELITRDVVILTDTDPAAKSPLREKLRPRGFMLVLIAKDGTVYLRKPFPWDVRELSRSIDKLPLRQQEIRERRTTE